MLVESVAIPEAFRVCVPMLVPLSVNWILPVGVPFAEVTVVEKVTFWPEMEGLRDEVREIEVALASTTT